MAAPAYTTDLVTIVDYDGTSGTAAEPATGWTAGRSPVNNDTDFPIQSSTHASLTMNTTGKAGLVTTGSTFTWTSGDYLFGWIIWLAPGAIATQSAGGLAMLAGTGVSAYKVWYVGGSDWGAYPYGGWQNFAVDPTLTADETFGTATGYYVVGCGANVLSAVSKGNPLGNDAFRYGRGELRVANGNVTDGYATFTGMATANDASAARWGLFQAIPGGYKMKGKLYFGYVAATEFTDANKNIVIDDMIYVNSDFNRIEFHNTSTVINWDNISFSALGTTSKGQLEMIDDCTVNDDGGVFTDMDTFIYLSGYTGDGRTWRRCAQVTQGGGTFTNCLFDKSTSAVSLLVDDLSKVTKCTFISDGSNHAVNLGTISTTQAITWDNQLSGYASSNGSTGNEAILVNVASGETLTINVTATADTPYYYNTGSGDVVVSASINLTITVKDEDNSVIVGAYAYIDDNDNTPYILNTTTNASGIATTGYSGGAVSGSRWRVRKYGYKPFRQILDIGSSDISILVTLVADPQQT